MNSSMFYGRKDSRSEADKDEAERARPQTLAYPTHLRSMSLVLNLLTVIAVRL